MSEDGPEPAAGSIVSKERTKPPWWLITSWGRWAWFAVLYPGLMGFFALQRANDGRSDSFDRFFFVVLGVIVVGGLVQLVLTLLAYRRDPGLRTREWPSPPPGPGVSRRVCTVIALIAIAALGLVLLVYAGWQGALFVVLILAGLLVAFVRFDLFADDRPPAHQGDRLDHTEPRRPTPDR